MPKRTLTFILAALIIAATALSSLAAIPGAPKNSALVFSISMPAEGREPVNRIIEALIKSEFYSNALKKFHADFGFEFPGAIIDRIFKISAASVVFTIDPRKAEDYLIFGVFLTLDTEADAEEVLKSAGTIFETDAAASKDQLMLKETGFNQVRTFTPDTAENQVRIISCGRTAGIAFTMATAEADIKESFKPILLSFTSEAENVSSLEKFSRAFNLNAKAFNALVYFNSDFMNSLSQNKKNEDVKEYIESGAFSFSLAPDLSSAAFNGSLFLAEPQSTDAVEIFNLINALASSRKDGEKAAASLPGDILSFLDVKFHLGDEFWASPIVSKHKKAAFMNLMNLNDDVLSWFDGSVFAALGEYSVDFAALREMRFAAPEVYIGLGSKNAGQAFKFLDKTKLLISNFTSVDMKISDETIENILATVYQIPDMPVKNLEICAASFGSRVILTSSRNAFKKIAAVETKKEPSLASGDYKEVADSFGNSFFCLYSRASKIVDILNLLALIRPEFSAASDFTFLKQSAFSGRFAGRELSVSGVFSIDAKKFSFENIMKRLETFKSSAGK